MKKQEMLDKINAAIRKENGVPVKMDDKFVSSGLDSLGLVIVMLEAESMFPATGQHTGYLSEIDVPNITMRELVGKCRLASTSPPPAE